MKPNRLKMCAGCAGPLTGKDKKGIQFFVVRVSSAIIDQRAVQERVGLLQFFGDPAAGALAEVFSSRADVAHIVGDQPDAEWTELLFCQDCYMLQSPHLPTLVDNDEKLKEMAKCEHEVVDAQNATVKSGTYCAKCGKVNP